VRVTTFNQIITEEKLEAKSVDKPLTNGFLSDLVHQFKHVRI